MAVREAVITPPKPKPKPKSLDMSYEEFLRWADEDVHAEWVDGKVIVQMPPKEVHQSVIGFLYALVRLFASLFDLGRVHTAPFEMKLNLPHEPAREPDILFVANQNLDRLTEDRLVGPADLIVEIISGDSVRRDRHDKFREYREAGVREYWIIDPRPGKQRADFYVLDEDGDYFLFATEDDQRVESHVLPGFWLRPDWLWKADSLDPFQVLCEMAGLPESFVEQWRERLRAGLRPEQAAES